ncbi:MAG: 50S ribosome-binding GTPase, partial [Planctomycetes bacterium]|nr:50S ribosome-binding GTPase [Planctomycetota bacterium]
TGSRFDAVEAEVASPNAGPPAPNPADVSLSRPTAAAAVGGEMVTYGPGGRLVKPAPPAPEPAGIAQLQEQVRALHVRVAEMSRSGDRTRAAHGAPAVSDGARPALDLALATLLERELPESLARDVAARAAAALTPDQGGSREALRAALVGLLAEVVASAPEPAVARGVRRVVALVGGTGVGKTTTIAKLAAKARVGGEAAVGIVTVDTYRIAAVDQLRTIADIISVPLRAVTSPKDLGEALAEFAEMDLVFLDTAGRTHRDRLRMSELRAFLAVARADETHLVLPAVTSLSNMLDMARAYGVTGVNRLLFTKLDEAVCLGPLFGAAAALKTVLSYVTAGQDIPEDIEPADPRRLADLFLADAP